MRAMFMPALHMAVSTSSDSLAGPMVQMILVFLMGVTSQLFMIQLYLLGAVKK